MNTQKMNVEQNIKTQIQSGLQKLFDFSTDNIQIQETRKEFAGSHTVLCFPFTKQAKKKPEEIGEALGNYLKEQTDWVADFNVVKGFLNIVLKDEVWLKIAQRLFQDEKFGQLAPKNEKVMVEFSSPNTNKPLHLGHLRTNFLGDSVSYILKAAGYEVIKTCVVNDRGIHICKSMLAYNKFGNDETPASAGIKGDKLVGKYYVAFDKAYKEDESLLEEAKALLIKWEEGEQQTVSLWEKLNNWVYDGFEDTYQKIGVSFDKIYYESNTYLLGKDIVQEGLNQGVFEKREDNSIWINLEKEKLDQKLLLRSDGTSVYMTQDLGLADLKFQDYGMKKSIYVVGDEQDHHFKVLFTILKKLGRSYAEGLHHLSYGMVDLPSGKMKSREGTVVEADELLQEMEEIAKARTQELGKVEELSEADKQELYHILALGALRYFLLRVDPKKRMLFNPEESIDFQGDTGVFIQFAYVRTASILRKAAQVNVDFSQFEKKQLHPTEQRLIYLLDSYASKIEEAANNYNPSSIAQFAYDLAKAYSQFWTECPIFDDSNPENTQFRIALTQQVGKGLKQSLALLGVQVPERM